MPEPIFKPKEIILAERLTRDNSNRVSPEAECMSDNEEDHKAAQKRQKVDNLQIKEPEFGEEDDGF